MKLYRKKPLVWESWCSSEWIARAIPYDYNISRFYKLDSSTEYGFGNSKGPIRGNFKTFEEAAEAAESHWQDAEVPGFEEVAE